MKKRISFFFLLLLLTTLVVPLESVSAAAYVTLDRYSGPSTSVVLRGGGWTPGHILTLYVGSVNDIPAATVTVKADGSVGPVPLPLTNARSGSVSIFAVDTTTREEQQNSYYVEPLAPSIAVTGSSTPGSAITVTGKGFRPNEAVMITLGTHTLAQVNTQRDGSFASGRMAVPRIEPGTYPVRARGQSSEAEAVGYHYVSGFYPYVSPSTYYLLPGQELHFSGGGFAPGEKISVTEGVGSASIALITANAGGEFKNDGRFRVPLQMSGKRTFYLTGEKSGGTVGIDIEVGEFQAQMYPSSYFIAPQSVLTFTGYGFAAGEKIHVYDGENMAPIVTMSANSRGEIKNQGKMVIPFSWMGSSRMLQAVGAESGAASEFGIRIGELNPLISPSTYFVAPGERFTISGTGFAVGESVAITIEGVGTVTTTATSTGSFVNAGPFVAPYRGASLHAVAVGDKSGVKAIADIVQGTLNPQVTPNTWHVPSGSDIIFSGTGFAPGELVRMTNNQGASSTITADAKGSFRNHAVATDFGDDRSVTYTFVGDKSGAATALSVSIAGLAPYLSLDTYYAMPGSLIRVWGSGFASGEAVTLSTGEQSVNAKANVHGAVTSTAVTLPIIALDNAVTVLMTGNKSRAIGTARLSLIPFTPFVFPSGWHVQPGSTVSFTGSGFAPGEAVTIRLHDMVIDTVTTTATGTLATKGFRIPFGITSAEYSFMGTKSKATQTVTLTVAALNTGLNLSVYYADGGAPLTITATGYVPGEDVSLSFGDTVLGSVIADKGGNAVMKTRVPYQMPGDKTITATGKTSGASSWATFTQAAKTPIVELGAYSGAPGSHVTIIGKGFVAGESVVVTADRGDIRYFTTADAVGNIMDTKLRIPPVIIEGNLQFTITSEKSHSSTQITYYVTG